MISTRAFTGKMNYDRAPERLPAEDYLDGLNIERDGSDEKIVAPIKGNRLVAYTLPAGGNECIGTFSDEVRGRLYYFVYNALGNHSILYYNKATDSIVKVLQSSLLQFSADYPVLHCDVVYRDEGDDLLFFTRGEGVPSVLNVARAASGGYAGLPASALDVALIMPPYPPAVTYEDDATVTVNNLHGKLFKFRYRYVYPDGEKSCWSTHSDRPIPLNYTDSATDPDPTRNARIRLTLKEMPLHVEKVEVAACESRGSVWSDFFLIRTLDRVNDGLDVTVPTELTFYNDEAYSYIDLKESLLEFDRVPLRAKTQALVNGNVLVYGGLTEGYDWAPVTGLVTPSTEAAPLYGPAFDFWSRYGVSRVYFDEKGRSDGARYSEDMRVVTPAYVDGEIPKLTIELSGRPPEWARSWQLLLTKNLSKSKLLYWVTDQTFKDTEWAYISIENLNTFKAANPTTPLGYDFAPRDRVRFVKKLSGTPGLLAQKDFEIKAQLIDPEISGQKREGQFLKIALPATGADFDFGSGDYFNYLVELYTPAQSVEGGLDVSYEIGEAYEIGDPGEATRHHRAHVDQTPDGATPASLELSAGDDYYRTRTINTGAELKFKVVAGAGADSNAGRCVIGMAFVEASYTDPNILTQNTVTDNLVDFDYDAGETRWNIKVAATSPVPYTFRFKGSIAIKFEDDFPADSLYEIYFRLMGGSVVHVVPPFDSTSAGVRSFPVDVTFTLQPGQWATLIGWSLANLDHSRAFIETDLTFTRQLPYTVGVIDPNFSDYFPSAVNAYGRPWVEDRNARQAYYPTLVRFGGEYGAGTLINKINRFYDEAQDTYDRGAGDIEKLALRGRSLYVFQRLNIGVVPVLTQVWRDLNGSPTTAESDKLLNQIQYPFSGRHGIGSAAASYAAWGGAQYFVNYLGQVCRLSQDGITVLSEVYECEDLLRPLLAGGARVSGAVLPDRYKYYLSIGGDEPMAVCFFDTRGPDQGFEARLSFSGERLAALGGTLASLKAGALWLHDTDDYTLYGAPYEASVTACFNDGAARKSFISVQQVGGSVWACPLVYTDQKSYGAQRQESSLLATDFEAVESIWSAELLRDVHSPGGLFDGDTLKGRYLVAKFHCASPTNLVTLNYCTVAFIESPLNNR
jgi:hypothetical protein